MQAKKPKLNREIKEQHDEYQTRQQQKFEVEKSNICQQFKKRKNNENNKTT
ncbi:unnamed protein product (macronuclear) [Paramecium tetraurelia]|uniref:Uncharacterized protein n=1 Tax=Paramecium tetraurelia TaxID=5888 RepID=A0C2D0_PARTE|nr:uncharacterized protein GSPATT00034424001 [Paramecium tetraurelia]CAK64947.1 unnamed protein product [Paramecium tetraurelia]|eukprot:XP_001432344.1 hypothetical protein (macronuclear) [Paramecium tetraurelia strain d4-2]